MKRHKPYILNFDYEDVASLTDEQREILEEVIFWRLGDFDLIDKKLKKDPQTEYWNRRNNEGDRFPIDYQGYDDEEANLRKGIK